MIVMIFHGTQWRFPWRHSLSLQREEYDRQRNLQGKNLEHATRIDMIWGGLQKVCVFVRLSVAWDAYVPTSFISVFNSGADMTSNNILDDDSANKSWPLLNSCDLISWLQALNSACSAS